MRGFCTRQGYLPLAVALVALMPTVLELSAATIIVPGPATNVPPLRFAAIGAGETHSLGVLSNGTVMTWGYNYNGQLNVPSGLSGVTAVTGGDDYSLALKSDGTVVAWGGNAYGQINVPPGLSNVVAVAAQFVHSLALKSNGHLVTWPAGEVPGDLVDVVAIAEGQRHNLAIRSNGTVEAWGENTYGQCNVPAGLSNVVGIAAGWVDSLALKSDGTVVAWGSSIYGETNIPSGLSRVTAISAYGANCAALKSDGTVVAWGDYRNGGIITNVPEGLSNVVAIATGAYHTLALRADGSVVGWGDNSWGQAFVPVPVITDRAIQDALNAANDGDTILVAPGVYFRTNPITITKAITLRSTMGPGQTFLNIGLNDWVLSVSNIDAVIDGFTVAPTGVLLVGGTVKNCNFTNTWEVREGSPVFMIGGTLSNCIVSYQRFEDGGSAVHCAGGLVANCQIVGSPGPFRNNGIGDGIRLVGGQLRDSLISGLIGSPEKSDGKGVFAVASTIVGCTITHNASYDRGGGAYLESCLMDRCTVTGNVSWGGYASGIGGGGIFETNSIIRNSLVVGNRGDLGHAFEDFGGFGGGIYMQGGALVNCTVADNTTFGCAKGHGAGVYVESGGLTNCIIFSNYFNYYCYPPPPDSEWFNVGTGVFDHCCTIPDPGGVGNILQDPQFLDPTNGDFHLASSSPCITAGVVQPWMIGAMDLDGNPRTVNGVVDIGAYQRATPLQLAESIIGQVNDLVANGALNRGQGQALAAKLGAAADGMKDGRIVSVCNQLASFLNQVNVFMGGRILNHLDAQALIDAGESLRLALGCE